MRVKAAIVIVGILGLVFLLRSPGNKVEFPEETNLCEGLNKNHHEKLSTALAPFRKQMKNQTGVLPLETGESAMLARAWLSDAAERSIDVQYFIFKKDNVGLIAFDYLVHAADRGVKVRVLVDDFMLEFEEDEVLAMASHPNIDIKIYNPGVNLGKNFLEKIKKYATDFKGANQRMHNKQFVVDGEVLITGGRNVEGMYFDFDHEYNFRDRDVLFIGKAAREGQESFEQYWNNELSVNVTELLDGELAGKETESQFSALHNYACDPNNFWPQIREEIKNLSSFFEEIRNSDKFVWTEKATMVCDTPGKNQAQESWSGGGLTTQKLVELVSSAEHSIAMQTPYLITTEDTRKLFKNKTDAGVDIRILTNSLASTDNVEAFSGYQRDRDALLNTGVSVFEFRPDAAVRLKIAASELQELIDHRAIFGTHAKTMVVDNRITVISTFNLDPRSANLNTECLAIIDDQKIAKSVMEGIEEEFKQENSWQITLEWNPDGEVDLSKRVKTWTRRVIPKDVL